MTIHPPPPRPPTNSPASPQVVARATGAPDGGWGWVVVTASFILNCIVDGVCFSFGVFYVELLYEFNESSAKTALVGALLPGMYLIIGRYLYWPSVSLCLSVCLSLFFCQSGFSWTRNYILSDMVFTKCSRPSHLE